MMFLSPVRRCSVFMITDLLLSSPFNSADINDFTKRAPSGFFSPPTWNVQVQTGSLASLLQICLYSLKSFFPSSSSMQDRDSRFGAAQQGCLSLSWSAGSAVHFRLVSRGSTSRSCRICDHKRAECWWPLWKRNGSTCRIFVVITNFKSLPFNKKKNTIQISVRFSILTL